LRHGPPPTYRRASDGADSYTGPDREVRKLADRIEKRLSERSLTRREIGETVAGDANRVDAALAHLEAEDRVERAGSTYRTVSRESSALDGVREWLAAVGGQTRARLARLVWPATVEFGTTAETAESGHASTSTSGESTSTSGESATGHALESGPDEAPVEQGSPSHGNDRRRQPGRERERDRA